MMFINRKTGNMSILSKLVILLNHKNAYTLFNNEQEKLLIYINCIFFDYFNSQG